MVTHKLTQCSTYTTPHLPPTLAAPSCRTQKHPLQQISATQILLTNSQHTTSAPNHNPYSKTHCFLSHTSHYIILTEPPPTGHSIHNAAAAKSNAVFNMQLRLILHLCALAVWQYTLNTSQPSMNQETVCSRHYRARTRTHRLLKRTTKYLGTHKMTQCSTYRAPGQASTNLCCVLFPRLPWYVP